MSENNYHIRLATSEDLSAIREVEVAASYLFQNTDYSFLAGSDPMSLELLDKQQKEGLVWIVCGIDQTPVGFIVLMIVDGMAHIEELSVDTKHGRRGLGKRLIKTACEWAKREGYSGITLSTFRDIEWNAPYYRRLGFSIMKPEELGAGLLKLRENEKRLGLPVDERVFMRLEL